MLDVKVIVVGVAGIFLGLGVAAASMVGMGHVATALGQVLGSNPITQGGNALSGLGIDIIVLLAIMAFIVVAAFLYVLGRH
jgi:hypothetical protein